MTEQEKIIAENNELGLLISKGVNIEVERRIFKKQKGVLGFIQRRVPVIEKLKFTIQEPTLSTLDRISAQQIELHIDENIMSSDQGVQEAKKMTGEQSRRLARILAITVLGQDYVIAIQKGQQVVYKFDDARLNELTDLFFHSIQPSKLLQYSILINTMSNLGDFTNSIRLMSAARTTMPSLIEEDKKD
ncbi:MAG: hypothetical protein ACM3Q2_10350 [Syntrophothermus sp.]